ncbi:MAG: C40 family peptidase [Ignavibacteria bacterium]|jgi:SH3-like domain-containing protein|nr:C40 family peptidase [Ignavibacteria bacterium]MDH7528415.1 C40 family peptidase [Ignavibacteria bacterium]
MKILLFLINLLLTTYISAMNQDIEEIIGQIKSRLAPDKRTAIFSVSYLQEGSQLILQGEVSDKLFKEKLLNELSSNPNYTIVDSIEVLPSKKLGSRIYGIVNLSVCNIRSKPDHPEELSTQALMGTPVRILKESNGWFLIQTPDDYLGWVDDDGIARYNAEEMINWLKSKKIIYTEFFGFIYSDKNFSEKISDIVAGNILKLVNSDKKTFEVELPDGRKGYINRKEAKLFDDWYNSLDFQAASIIKTAKQMMGFPYLWGGTSIKGIDCSGFMKTIFFLNGLILSRDANQQALLGSEVPFDLDFSHLKPGDLIFFGRRASETRPERITHVGLYLGDKRFIHSSGRVRLDSFDKDDPNYNEYRLNTIVRVKRILDQAEILEELKIKNNKFYREEFYK